MRALSMGVLHKAVPMTLGLCIGVSAGIQGSIVDQIIKRKSPEDNDGYPRTVMVRMNHPTGTVEVGAEFGRDGEVRSAKVTRTGKRLMKGFVYW